MNPSHTASIDFEHASAEGILSALLPNRTDPQSDMWVGRAHLMLEALIPALVELRDAGQIVLNKESLSESLTLDSVATLQQDRRLSEASRHLLEQYLNMLPSFNEHPQGLEAEMHHGFLTMQVASALR